MHRSLLRILGVFALVGAAACTTSPEPAPPPKRAVDVSTGHVRFVPGVPAASEKALTHELAVTLQTLYSKAFILPNASGPKASGPKASGPTPSPAPTGFDVMTAIGPYFSPAARGALRQHIGAFSLGPHLDLLKGHAFFEGVVTRTGELTTAKIAVRFSGSASRSNEADTVLLVGQTGTMHLTRTEAGWFVREFDLKLKTIPPPPTPTPT